MAPLSEDSEDSLSKPMSLRYLPPPSPALSVSSYAHQGYIPDRYPRSGTVHPNRPTQDQHAFDPIFVHDYRAYTMEYNYERPQVLPSQDTPRPGLSRAHPESPGSPMQLDFILNDPKSLSPSSPSPLQITQSSDSPSPREPEPTRPQQPNEAESSPPPPQPQDNKPVHSTRSTTARQTTTKFEAITAHTAKCDLCNRRNDAGMSRCLSCGWQSCHSCTMKNGCTRTHKAGSREHTGPIDSRELVSGTSGGGAAAAGTAPRGRKKARGRGKSRGRGGAPSRSRMGREGEGEDRERERDRDDSPATLVDVDAGVGHVSSPVEKVSSSPGIDSSQGRDMIVEGARNLYAFSLEAYMSWTQEQKGKGREDPGSDWGAFAGIEDFHSYAQEEATRAFGQYSQNR